LSRRVSGLVSLVILGLGIAIIVRTIVEGIGGGAGLIVGAILVFGGAARLYLSLK
jgi:hypothetical protein